MPPVDEGTLNKWRSFLLGILGSVLILLMGVIWGVRARHSLEGGPMAAPNVGTSHVSPSTRRSGVALAEVNQKREEMRRRSLASYAMVSLGVISFVASWFVFKFPKLCAAVMGIAAVVPAILAPTSLVVGWLLLAGCWAGFRARDPEKEVLDQLAARWLAGLGPEQRQEGLEILQEAVAEGCRYADGRLVPAAGSPELTEVIQDGLDGYARSLGRPGIETKTPAERFSLLRLRVVRRSMSRLSEASAALGKGIIDGQVTPEAARTQGQALLKDIARIAPKVRTLTNPGEIWALERELNEVQLEAQLAIEGRMRTPRVLHEQIHRLSDASYALGKGIIDGLVTPDAARTQGEAIVKEVGEIAKEVEAIVSNVGSLPASPDVTQRLERDLNEVCVEAQYAVDGRIMSPRLNRYTSERELVEGKPIQLGDGTTVEVHNVGYAHLGGGRNLSLCTLRLDHGGQTREMGLSRVYGGDKPPESVESFGWRFTLMTSDPYHQPSTASVRVERVVPG